LRATAVGVGDDLEHTDGHGWIFADARTTRRAALA
jgi:hypothetical protein